jgi:hypothetical protein
MPRWFYTTPLYPPPPSPSSLSLSRSSLLLLLSHSLTLPPSRSFLPAVNAVDVLYVVLGDAEVVLCDTLKPPPHTHTLPLQSPPLLSLSHSFAPPPSHSFVPVEGEVVVLDVLHVEGDTE